MARGRWLPKCPTCGNENGLRFVRAIDEKLRVYECLGKTMVLRQVRLTVADDETGSPYADQVHTAMCRTEFVCKLWTLHGEIEDMISELRTRIDEFRM